MGLQTISHGIKWMARNSVDYKPRGHEHASTAPRREFGSHEPARIPEEPRASARDRSGQGHLRATGSEVWRARKDGGMWSSCAARWIGRVFRLRAGRGPAGASRTNGPGRVHAEESRLMRTLRGT